METRTIDNQIEVYQRRRLALAGALHEIDEQRKVLESQRRMAEDELNQIAGALAVLRDIRAALDKECKNEQAERKTDGELGGRGDGGD